MSKRQELAIPFSYICCFFFFFFLFSDPLICAQPFRPSRGAAPCGDRGNINKHALSQGSPRRFKTMRSLTLPYRSWHIFYRLNLDISVHRNSPRYKKNFLVGHRLTHEWVLMRLKTRTKLLVKKDATCWRGKPSGLPPRRICFPSWSRDLWAFHGRRRQEASEYL